MPVPDVCDQPATDCGSQPACHGIGSVGIIGIADNERRLASNWSELGDGSSRAGPSPTANEVIGNGFSTTERKARRQRPSQGSSGGAVRVGWGVIAGDAPEGTDQRISIQIGL